MFAVAGLVFAAGCATAPGPSGDTDLLAFLEDGRTTRAEAVARLGEPSAQLQADGILCYRVGGNAERGYAIVAPRTAASLADAYGVNLSLVLVFDEGGVLRRHALVPVR